MIAYDSHTGEESVRTAKASLPQGRGGFVAGRTLAVMMVVADPTNQNE